MSRLIEEYRLHGPQIISKDSNEVRTITSISGGGVSYVCDRGLFIGCGMKQLINDGWTWIDGTPILKTEEK